MRHFFLLCLSALLCSCMSVSDMAERTRYHLSDAGILDHSDVRRSASWRLQPDSSIFIAQSHFAPGGTPPPRPNVVAEEAFNGFVEYFPMVRRAAAPAGLDEALGQAREAGADYLLYARFAAADDRIGTWDEWADQELVDRLGTDSSVIQLMLVDTSTLHLIDSARIRSRGGLLTLYDKRPEDFLGPPMRDYARQLMGLRER